MIYIIQTPEYYIFYTFYILYIPYIPYTIRILYGKKYCILYTVVVPGPPSDSGTQTGLVRPTRVLKKSRTRTILHFGSLLTSLNVKMSPIAHAGAGAASKDVKKESATARLLGSGMILLVRRTYPTMANLLVT